MSADLGPSIGVTDSLFYDENGLRFGELSKLLREECAAEWCLTDIDPVLCTLTKIPLRG